MQEAEKHIIFEDENVNLTCEYSPIVPYLLVMHCVIFNWSPSLYKKYILLWEDIIGKMAEQGVTKLGIVVLDEDIKLMKFATMFGFNVENETFIENEPAIFMAMDIGE